MDPKNIILLGVVNNLAIKHARVKYVLCLNTDKLLINNDIKIMYSWYGRSRKSKRSSLW